MFLKAFMSTTWFISLSSAIQKYFIEEMYLYFYVRQIGGITLSTSYTRLFLKGSFTEILQRFNRG